MLVCNTPSSYAANLSFLVIFRNLAALRYEFPVGVAIWWLEYVEGKQKTADALVSCLVSLDFWMYLMALNTNRNRKQIVLLGIS
jgi:hypothetical protein